MNDTDLQRFYLDLVVRLRSRGVLCAITSGLACVHYNIAETTKDCDLLCHSSSFGQLLEILSTTEVEGHPCRYRGNLSPPLDERWHSGGWTSHFQWGSGLEAVTLDVFGRALRGSIPWELDIAGLYAGPHIVAEMKRTNREKDWPFITALGTRLIRAGDPRGWLHIFDADVLTDLLTTIRPPEEIAQLRPALALAAEGDRKTIGALHAERCLWEELDRRRVAIYERALRPYVVAVRQSGTARASEPLHAAHQTRLRAAEEKLEARPLEKYGIERHIEDAKAALLTASILPAEALAWLPDVRANFSYLQS